MGELPEVLDDDRINDDLPQLEFTNAFSVYVVLRDKPSGVRCRNEHNMVFSYEVGKAPFAAILKESAQYHHEAGSFGTSGGFQRKRA